MPALDKHTLTSLATDTASWLEADEVATQVGPVTNASPSHPDFELRRGRTWSRFPETDQILSDLSKEVAARPYLVEDAAILGCGFLVFTQSAFLKESKYLNS